MDDTGRRSLNESPAISMSYGRATVGYRPEGDSSPTIIETIMEPGTADVVVFMICVTVIVLAAMGAVLKYLGIKKARPWTPPAPMTQFADFSKGELDVERAGLALDPTTDEQTNKTMYDLVRARIPVNIVEAQTSK